MKRLFDIIMAIIGLLIITIPFIFIYIIIKVDSHGPIFFRQLRVGQNGCLFYCLKFCTMYFGSEKHGTITIDLDDRNTRSGKYLRKYKIDEMPQIWNVLIGDMSIVGPRPDVPKYSKYYQALFPDYYKMKPGITCYSSLELSNEAELYIGIDDPEKFYIEKVIPLKVELDKKYFYEQSLKTDIKIILLTIKKIFIERNKE